MARRSIARGSAARAWDRRRIRDRRSAWGFGGGPTMPSSVVSCIHRKPRVPTESYRPFAHGSRPGMAPIPSHGHTRDREVRAGDPRAATRAPVRGPRRASARMPHPLDHDHRLAAGGALGATRRQQRRDREASATRHARGPRPTLIRGPSAAVTSGCRWPDPRTDRALPGSGSDRAVPAPGRDRRRSRRSPTRRGHRLATDPRALRVAREARSRADGLAQPASSRSRWSRDRRADSTAWPRGKSRRPYRGIIEWPRSGRTCSRWPAFPGRRPPIGPPRGARSASPSSATSTPAPTASRRGSTRDRDEAPA